MKWLMLLQQPTFTLNGMPRSVVQNLLSHELIEQTDRPNSFKKSPLSK